MSSNLKIWVLYRTDIEYKTMIAWWVIHPTASELIKVVPKYMDMIDIGAIFVGDPTEYIGSNDVTYMYGLQEVEEAGYIN